MMANLLFCSLVTVLVGISIVLPAQSGGKEVTAYIKNMKVWVTASRYGDTVAGNVIYRYDRGKNLKYVRYIIDPIVISNTHDSIFIKTLLNTIDATNSVYIKGFYRNRVLESLVTINTKNLSASFDSYGFYNNGRIMIHKTNCVLLPKSKRSSFFPPYECGDFVSYHKNGKEYIVFTAETRDDTLLVVKKYFTRFGKLKHEIRDTMMLKNGMLNNESGTLMNFEIDNPPFANKFSVLYKQQTEHFETHQWGSWNTLKAETFHPIPFPATLPQGILNQTRPVVLHCVNKT